jgi:hypothetical protein
MSPFLLRLSAVLLFGTVMFDVFNRLHRILNEFTTNEIVSETQILVLYVPERFAVEFCTPVLIAMRAANSQTRSATTTSLSWLY